MNTKAGCLPFVGTCCEELGTGASNYSAGWFWEGGGGVRLLFPVALLSGNFLVVYLPIFGLWYMLWLHKPARTDYAHT